MLPAILSTGLPLSQEVALMYANGRVKEAAAKLALALERNPGDLQLWTLLFDLYRAQDSWREFEALVSEFERAFNRTGPQWLSEQAIAGLPEELRRGGSAFVEIAGVLDAQQTNACESLRGRAGAHSTVHLDLRKVTDLTPEGCRALSSALALAADSVGVLLTGAEHLARLVHNAAEGNGSEMAYWALLLELYRLRGMQTDFERIALECALAAGVPPPAWQPVIVPVVAPPDVQEKRDAPRYQAGPEVFSLSATMTGAVDLQLRKLQQFAQERRYVNIDLARLARMDLGCAARFVEFVNGLARSDRTVRLIRPNSLVATLLSSFTLAPGIVVIAPQAI